MTRPSTSFCAKRWDSTGRSTRSILAGLQRLAHGDLGQSLRTQRAVLDTVVERYPATIYLALASLILGTVIAIPGGNSGGRQAKHACGIIPR